MMELDDLRKKLNWHQGEVKRLQEEYDRVFAHHVRAKNLSAAHLTVPQILHLVPIAEGTLRNRMCRMPLQQKVCKRNGNSGLLWADVRDHLLVDRRGTIGDAKAQIIRNLAATTELTHADIAEHLGISLRTVRRVLADPAGETS
jgi:hypothetical protein